MTDLYLIGIATGNPDHLTQEARDALRAARLVLVPYKGSEKSDLAELRYTLIGTFCDRAAKIVEFQMPERDPDVPYIQRVDAWHDQIAAAWQNRIAQYPDAGPVALLVWGDPSLYDSTLRIAARLAPRPRVRVVPGLTSLQLLTAAHAIPLNTVGGEILITTGRQLSTAGWPDRAETVAVMLDGSCAFQHMCDENLDIWWGAYLGMPGQILRAGPLNAVASDIIAARATAKKQHGWIMDIYILRRCRK